MSCVNCHGGLPGALHGIERAAGSPAIIEYAIGAIPQMTPLRERLTAEDRADIAAYLGFPSVPSPGPQLSTDGPAASPYNAMRLEFRAAPGAAPTPPSHITLTNTGALPLRLGAAPAIDGPDATQFVLVATDCRAEAVLQPQQSCAIEVAFIADRATGLRSARVGLSHDWIGTGFNVALIGRVTAGEAPGARN